MFKKLLILRPPPVKSLTLFGKRFLCLSLALLHYDVGFQEFPDHSTVLDKKVKFELENSKIKKLLISHPPPVRSLTLFGKRFLCLSLALLHYDLGFQEFPDHSTVLNKKFNLG
jgi:hypothetical protein